MSLLDRLLSRPKWQSSDPAVRAAAVRDMEADQQPLLQQLARTDPEAQVRRAALKRLGDPSLLAEAAKNDTDEALRKDAAEMLLDHALGATDAAVAALGLLSEPKHLAAVAREGRHAGARAAALDRVQDPKALASVARASEDAALRAKAVERIRDAAVLADLALKSDHKDVALSALERVDDLEALEAIAARGKHKAAVKRAKALVAQRKPKPEPAPAPKVDHRPRRLQILLNLEAISSAADLTGAAERLAVAVGTWEALDDDPDAELRARYDAACAAVRERLERAEREAEVARQAMSAQERELVLRRALVSRVEGLQGTGIPAGVEEIRKEWEGYGAPGSPDVAKQFEDAVKAAQMRFEKVEADRHLHDRLEELTKEIEALAAGGTGRRFSDVRRDFRGVSNKVTPDAAVRARFEAALGALETRAADARREREAKSADHLKKVEEVLARVEAIAAQETLTLKDGEKALRDIRSALDDRTPLPPADRERIQNRLKDARGKIYPKVQELRETDEWKRFGNAGAREELIARMEALGAETDLQKADNVFRELQTGWSKAAEVPRNDFEPLRQRWNAAREPVWTKLEAWRKERHAQMEAGLEKKRELVARAEAIADSTDWVKTAQEMQKLQEEWKQSPPAPRKESQQLWERFRAAGSRFFERRKKDLSERKELFSGNLEKKEALVARAEELAQSTEWEKTAAEFKKLQADWKATGPVAKAKSDEIWKRFRGAADTFFDRYKRRDELAAEAQDADRDRIAREMESLADALAPAAADHVPPAPADLALRVSDVLERWSRQPGGKRKADPIAERLFAARDRLLAAHAEAFQGTDLDPAGNLQRLEQLCSRVEELAMSVQAPKTRPADLDAETLAKLLRESLAARTMGAPSEEETRWTSAQADVESAQAAWKRVGPVPGTEGEAVAARFKAACDRFFSAKPRGLKTSR